MEYLSTVKMMVVLRFIVIVIHLIHLINGDRVVMTTTGPVQGISVEAGDSELDAFLGIPYAEPPVGRLRFSRPVPKTPWTGVYDASKLPPTCIQNVTQPYYYTPDVTNMTEDCLYLNIWVPCSQLNSKPKPILFYLHGGVFNIGSSNMKIYDGAKLAAHGDVIVVTINYRVGVMGFFSAFISDAAGNMGMYDQLTALKWIRANAMFFQGDPNHIVMVGESAGAISAAGHMMSPLTKHMIKRVILHSGAAMLPLAFDANERVYKISQALAQVVGCADRTVTLENNPRIIVACLKRLSADELARAEGLLMGSNPITFIPISGDELMPNNTVYMTRNGDFRDMEMLIGSVRDEGTIFLTAALPQYFGVYGANPVKSVSKRLAYQLTRMIHKALGEPSTREIADFYVNNVENGTSEQFTLHLSESIGDYLVTCSTMFQSEFHSFRRNPIYYFVFSHRTATTPLAEWMGATHYDEVQYLFGNPMFHNFTEEEELISQRMMDRWIAFAKTGNPNIEGEIHWPRYSYSNPEYLDIETEESVKRRPDDYRCEFWRERYLANIDDDLIQKIIKVRQSSASKLANKFTYFIAFIIVLIIY